jgi:hypothetical protein
MPAQRGSGTRPDRIVASANSPRADRRHLTGQFQVEVAHRQAVAQPRARIGAGFPGRPRPDDGAEGADGFQQARREQGSRRAPRAGFVAGAQGAQAQIRRGGDDDHRAAATKDCGVASANWRNAWMRCDWS